ncbi:MAG: hypothetical protein JNM07_02810 [Phycisphaerae bacterium]|nr:hypothetical protein [Phycisphaerae bacterium]
MALLRNPQAEFMARDALVLDLGDLRRQGEELLTRARAEAEQIRRAAHEERERIIAGASEEGHARGFEAGLVEGRAKGAEEGAAAAFSAATAALEVLQSGFVAEIDAFERDRDALNDAARADLLRLAVLIAERLTHRIIEQDPSVVVDQVEAALALVARRAELRLFINPEDRAMVERALPVMSSRLVAARHVRVEEDASVSRGSCVLRVEGGSASAGSGGSASGGVIDASIGTQVQRIVEALLPATGQRAGVIGQAGPRRANDAA